MTLQLANRVKRIKPSPTLSVSTKAEELKASGKNIINFSVGEPDFDTPNHIKEAAIQAIKEGLTKYTAVDGMKSLKKAVAQKFLRDNGLQYVDNQILVSCGAKQSLYNLFSALINPGDEVIVPAPYWVSYTDMVLLADGIPVIPYAGLDQQFKLTPDQLKSAITEKTRVLVLNSPSNPTGIAYTATELRALAEVLLSYPNILVVSDDIYEHTLWNSAPFTNILMVCPDLYDRCMVVNGVSKTYAMTGWRVGYAAGPAAIISMMKNIQSQSTSNPCSIAQAAALAAIIGDQSCIAPMVNAYKERHDFVVSEFKKISGVQILPCDGTFYCFPSFNDFIQQAGLPNDIALAEFLLNEAEVAIVPGSAFGAPGHIRLSYATSMDNLRKGMKQIQEACKKRLT